MDVVRPSNTSSNGLKLVDCRLYSLHYVDYPDFVEVHGLAGGSFAQWDLTGYSYPPACCPGHVDESAAAFTLLRSV